MFVRCPSQVKLRLFHSHCMCFCDVALWSTSNCHSHAFQKFLPVCAKCLKLFGKFSSVYAVFMGYMWAKKLKIGHFGKVANKNVIVSYTFSVF